MSWTPEELAAMATADAEIDQNFEMTLEERRESAERDRAAKMLCLPNDKAEIAAHQREYCQAHKAEIAAYKREHYQAHKAEIAAHKRAYYQAHKAERAAYQHAYRARKKQEEQDG